MAARFNKLKQSLRADHNLTAAQHSIVRAAKAFPTSVSVLVAFKKCLAHLNPRANSPQSVKYATEKVPVLQWLPNYLPKWLINDAIAEISVGVLLIPQALAFAALAGIPLQDGLLASWLPPLIYYFMGTSKGMESDLSLWKTLTRLDLSTGPTSIIGLLTGQVLLILSGAGQPGGASGAAGGPQ